jgi:DNA-binding NarL/FixJ family response regulator
MVDPPLTGALREHPSRSEAVSGRRRAVAFGPLTAMGVQAFAQRARRELQATGEKARKRTPKTRDSLTAQEAQIAELAREGHSNPEIGSQLFLSPRTVEWHMHRVFTQLGISSRRELRAVLRARTPDPQLA